MHCANGACTCDIPNGFPNAFSQTRADISLFCSTATASVTSGTTDDTGIESSSLGASPTLPTVYRLCNHTGSYPAARNQEQPPPIPPKLTRGTPPLPPKSSHHAAGNLKGELPTSKKLQLPELGSPATTICMLSCGLSDGNHKQTVNYSTVSTLSAPSSTGQINSPTTSRLFRPNTRTIGSPVHSIRCCSTSVQSSESQPKCTDSPRHSRMNASKVSRRLSNLRCSSPLFMSRKCSSPNSYTPNVTQTHLLNRCFSEHPFPVHQCPCKVNVHWTPEALPQYTIPDLTRMLNTACICHSSVNSHTNVSKSGCGGLRWLSQSLSRFFKLAVNRGRSLDSKRVDSPLKVCDAVVPDDRNRSLGTPTVPTSLICAKSLDISDADVPFSVVSCGGALWRRRSSSCYSANRSHLPLAPEDAFVSSAICHSPVAPTLIPGASSSSKHIPSLTPISMEPELFKQLSLCPLSCDSKDRLELQNGRTHPLPPSRTNDLSPHCSLSNAYGHLPFLPSSTTKGSHCLTNTRCPCSLSHVSQSSDQPAASSSRTTPNHLSPSDSKSLHQTTVSARRSPRGRWKESIDSGSTVAAVVDGHDGRVHHFHHFHHVHHFHHHHHHHHHVHLQSGPVTSSSSSPSSSCCAASADTSHRSCGDCVGHVCAASPTLCCAALEPMAPISSSASLESIHSRGHGCSHRAADASLTPTPCSSYTLGRSSGGAVTVSCAHTSRVPLSTQCTHSCCLSPPPPPPPPPLSQPQQQCAHFSPSTSKHLHPIQESSSSCSSSSKNWLAGCSVSSTSITSAFPATCHHNTITTVMCNTSLSSVSVSSMTSSTTTTITTTGPPNTTHITSSSPTCSGGIDEGTRTTESVPVTASSCADSLIVPAHCTASVVSASQSTAVELSDSRLSFQQSMLELRKMGWYWGPLSFKDAQILLAKRPDGTFLVRDSGHDMYILSLSFRVRGETYHTRIEHSQGRFSFWSQPQSHSGSTMVEFIEKAVARSVSGQFHYFLQSSVGRPPVEVPLLYPLSRFQVVPSLRHLARFAILSCIRHDHIDELPLPRALLSYLMEKQCFVESLEAFEEAMRDRTPLEFRPRPTASETTTTESTTHPQTHGFRPRSTTGSVNSMSIVCPNVTCPSGNSTTTSTLSSPP